MPLLPMWSGIVLCTVNTGNVITDSDAARINFRHIGWNFSGNNEIGVLQKIVFSHGIMTSFSHRKFTNSLTTRKLTLRQVVEFWYNMDIHDTNMDLIRNYNNVYSFMRYYYIITLQNVINSHNLTHNIHD